MILIENVIEELNPCDIDVLYVISSYKKNLNGIAIKDIIKNLPDNTSYDQAVISLRRLGLVKFIGSYKQKNCLKYYITDMGLDILKRCLDK